MKISSWLSLLYAHTLTLSTPLISRHGDDGCDDDVIGLTDAVGAIYLMTNEPDGNWIVTGEIRSDGSVSYRQAVNTFGLGGHYTSDLDQLDGSSEPNALLSQRSVKISYASQVLAAVNAGSNTVSLFSIDIKNPWNIYLINEPVPTSGEFPVSITFNSKGTRSCVLNSGRVNGVSCFEVDKQKGLRPIPDSVRSLNLIQTTPPTGPENTPSHVIFNEDETKLVVSVKGSCMAPGFLAVWDVADDGSLSEDFITLQLSPEGYLPSSMTNIKGQNAILATDPEVGIELFDLSSLTDTTDTAHTSNETRPAGVAFPIPSQSFTAFSSYSDTMDAFYLTDAGTSTIIEVVVDENLKASIVNQYSLPQSSVPLENHIARIHGKDFLFVLEANTTSVTVLSLDTPGKVSLIGSYNFAPPLQEAGLPINSNNIQGLMTFISS